MKYSIYHPPESLSKLVRYFWSLEGDASDDHPYIHRTMADGSAELVFHYRGLFEEFLNNGESRNSFASGISGPSRKYFRYKIKESFGIFGAYLYPFAIPVFFGLDTSTISNQTPDLYSILGREGGELGERICDAADDGLRQQILTDFLEKRLLNSRINEDVFLPVNHLIHSETIYRVEELARRYFISGRQFERTFKKYAGFSPKLYMRIIRFQSAIRNYGIRNQSLTQIAYDCGYYDQSHFIHDFREFSGYHPGHYFSGNNEATAWKEA